jgi:hypothetical protein
MSIAAIAEIENMLDEIAIRDNKPTTVHITPAATDATNDIFSMIEEIHNRSSDADALQTVTNIIDEINQRDSLQLSIAKTPNLVSPNPVESKYSGFMSPNSGMMSPFSGMMSPPYINSSTENSAHNSGFTSLNISPTNATSIGQTFVREDLVRDNKTYEVTKNIYRYSFETAAPPMTEYNKLLPPYTKLDVCVAELLERSSAVGVVAHILYEMQKMLALHRQSHTSLRQASASLYDIYKQLVGVVYQIPTTEQNKSIKKFVLQMGGEWAELFHVAIKAAR